MMSLVGFFYIILPQTASKKRTEACPSTLFSHHNIPLLALQVSTLDGASNIGSIIRKWNGFLSTMGNADHFEIRFPLDLDVKMKAMIFGACFLIVSLLLSASFRLMGSSILQEKIHFEARPASVCATSRHRFGTG